MRYHIEPSAQKPLRITVISWSLTVLLSASLILRNLERPLYRIIEAWTQSSSGKKRRSGWLLLDCMLSPKQKWGRGCVPELGGGCFRGEVHSDSSKPLFVFKEVNSRWEVGERRGKGRNKKMRKWKEWESKKGPSDGDLVEWKMSASNFESDVSPYLFLDDFTSASLCRCDSAAERRTLPQR